MRNSSCNINIEIIFLTLRIFFFPFIIIDIIKLKLHSPSVSHLWYLNTSEKKNGTAPDKISCFSPHNYKCQKSEKVTLLFSYFFTFFSTSLFCTKNTYRFCTKDNKKNTPGKGVLKVVWVISFAVLIFTVWRIYQDIMFE